MGHIDMIQCGAFFLSIVALSHAADVTDDDFGKNILTSAVAMRDSASCSMKVFEHMRGTRRNTVITESTHFLQPHVSLCPHDRNHRVSRKGAS